jgi:hypothetical protein
VSARESERETKVRDDRRDRAVRERGRGRRARAEAGRCWAARLGRARVRAKARASGPTSWAGPREKKKIGPSSVFVFLFQNFE